jgi:hypothetical protein
VGFRVLDALATTAATALLGATTIV